MVMIVTIFILYADYPANKHSLTALLELGNSSAVLLFCCFYLVQYSRVCTVVRNLFQFF